MTRPSPGWLNRTCFSQLIVLRHRFGVSCDSEGAGSVVSLEISNSGLKGSLNLNLPRLETLNVSDNHVDPKTLFAGDQPPISLVNLNIARNSIQGELPAVLDQMTKLTYLNIEGNYLSGTFKLGNLTLLQVDDNFFPRVQAGGFKFTCTPNETASRPDLCTVCPPAQRCVPPMTPVCSTVTATCRQVAVS